MGAHATRGTRDAGAGGSRRRRRRRATPVSVLGELLLTAGVVLALFVVHQLWWTGMQTHRVQAELREELERAWAAPPAAAAPAGPDAAAPVTARGAMGYLTVPRIGLDAVFSEGVGQAELANGPGHYPASAAPGQIGNVAFAAHRDGNAAHFSELDALAACDEIIVETAAARHVYRVLDLAGGETACLPGPTRAALAGPDYAGIAGRVIVDPGADGVVAPIPENAKLGRGGQPAVALLTLTTCHPHWSSANRMVVHAALERTEAKEGS